LIERERQRGRGRRRGEERRGEERRGEERREGTTNYAGGRASRADFLLLA